MTRDKQLLALNDLVDIYTGRATGQYGLALINQLAHEVPSAHHARSTGLSSSVEGSALLHDLRHLVPQLAEQHPAPGIDV